MPSQAFQNSYTFTTQNNERLRQNMLARQAGGMIADGDSTGAANVLNRGGYLDQARTVQSGADEQRKKEVEFAGNLATGIAKRVQSGQDPETAWREAEQWAASQGMRGQMQGLRQRYDAMGAEAFTQWLGSTAAKEYQLFQNEHGIYGVNKADPSEVVTAKQFPGKPQMYGDFLYIPEAEAEANRVGTPGFNPNAPDPRQMRGGGFDAVIDPLLKREGGFVARDGRSGAPANFGINQRYNPDVDVRNLTPDKAKELYRSRYWNAIGGDQLPPEAQAAVFDAAVNQGPQRAVQWWQQSGGDLAKFNQLRLQHYRTRPDYAQNGRSWEARVAETGGQQSLQGGAGGDDLGGAPQIPGMRTVGRVRGGEGKDAPSGYRWAQDGSLEAIKGGPADPAVRAMGTGSRREFASLRKEFNSLKEVENWKETAAAYNQIRALASKSNPTPADDMALTYAFMKANDPGSVVRESEFAMVARTAGLPDQVAIALDKLNKGQGLTPRIRQQLVQAAATMTLRRREAYDAQARSYRAIAGDLGANPDQLAEDPAKWRGRIKQTPAKPGKAPAAAKPSDGWGEVKVTP